MDPAQQRAEAAGGATGNPGGRKPYSSNAGQLPQGRPQAPTSGSNYAPLPAMPSVGVPGFTGTGLGPRDPHEDPQYLAFQRASGQSEADLRATNALQTSMLLRGAERQLPGLREGVEDQIRNIGLSATAAGTFGSGTRARDQNRTQVQGARAESDILTGAREQVAMLELDLARALAGLNREGAEQDIDARTRLALGAAPIGAR